MGTILQIALCTFRESVREKILLVALLFGAVLVGSSFFLSPLAIGARQKIVMDVGLASISILGVLTAILLGGTLVHKEIEKKAIYLVLTRPVARSSYLVGKLAGVVATVALVVCCMTAVMAVTVLLGKGSLRPVVFAAVYLSLLESAVITSIVIFFSTFTTPVLTSFFALCLFAAGSLSGDLRLFAQKFGGAGMRYVTDALYYMLPNLKVFNLRHEAVHALPVAGADLFLATGYAIVYAAAAVYFACLVFGRREFR